MKVEGIEMKNAKKAGVPSARRGGKVFEAAEDLDSAAEIVIRRIEQLVAAKPQRFFLHGINNIQISIEVGPVHVQLAIGGTSPGSYECTKPGSWQHPMPSGGPAP